MHTRGTRGLSVIYAVSLFLSLLALWLSSAVMDTFYLPFGVVGLYPQIITAILITILSIYVVAKSLEGLFHIGVFYLGIFFTLCCLFFTSFEFIFWLYQENDHLMFFRQGAGLKLSIAIITVALLMINRLPEVPTDKLNIRESLKLLLVLWIVFSTLEIVMMIFRNIYGNGHTEISSAAYYAVDCAMFGTLMILSSVTAAMLIYVLRSIIRSVK